MSGDALNEAGITPTTNRIAVGNEDPRALLSHIMKAAELAFDPVSPGFSEKFMKAEDVDEMFETIYVETHRGFARSRPRMAELME